VLIKLENENPNEKAELRDRAMEPIRERRVARSNQSEVWVLFKGAGCIVGQAQGDRRHLDVTYMS
jgi:hypothetical protein